jgi:hypothetical protein
MPRYGHGRGSAGEVQRKSSGIEAKFEQNTLIITIDAGDNLF